MNYLSFRCKDKHYFRKIKEKAKEIHPWHIIISYVTGLRRCTTTATIGC